MAAEPDKLCEIPPLTPAPAELSERAATLVRSYPECFWFWHPDVLSQPLARVRHLEDVRLVVEHLREFGGHRAWRDAQELQQCLSLLYRKTS